MNIKFDTRYKFTAKELDNETSYTYFGARYYDSDLSIWLSVDPMSDERRWVSPYAYCQWNPLILVDPSGMLDDNYTVDEQGYIKLEEKTDDDFDMLYTKESWDNGTKDKSIKVDKGVLNSKKTFSITDKKTEEKFSLDMYQVKGDDKARSLFEFLDKNTNVEWGITGIGNQETNMLTTIHDKDSEAGGPFLLKNNYTIRYSTHSHPYNLNPSEQDIKFAKKLNSKFNNATLYLYHKGFYIQYNEKGIVSNPFKLLPQIDIINTKN